MKNTYLTPVVLAVASLLAACGSTPQTTSLLEQTRVEYRAAQASPNVSVYAPQEMTLASDAMAQTEAVAPGRVATKKLTSWRI